MNFVAVTNLLKYLSLKLRLSKRKGLDKPIFLIASLTLAIMFMLAYYLATTGWVDGLGDTFISKVDDYSDQVQ